MKEKYDFGEKKVTSKPDNLQENTELKEQYDFVTENAWASATKAALGVANTGYVRNIAKGAAAGAGVGAVGGVMKNATKRDDDPTKKGIIGAAISGANKGAGVGAFAGGAARWAARRDFGKMGIKAMSDQAISTATNGLKGAEAASAAQKVINQMNSGAKSFTLPHSMMGISNKGSLARGTSSTSGIKGYWNRATGKQGAYSFGEKNAYIPNT